MSKEQKVNVAVIGLGFGAEFVPIYQAHRNVDNVAICTRNPQTLNQVGDRFDIPERLRFTDFQKVVEHADIDAIHIVTPIMEHARQSLASLEGGKHTACTVPMATTIRDCENIIEARQRVGKVYMMMETSLYTREYLYVKQMLDRGDFGRIQFIRGEHMQNMALDGWGDYWQGFPPFHYGTHALSPILYLLDTRAESVICHGSGHLAEQRAEKYGSPFAVETATFLLENTDVVAEASRCLFETVRQVRECFDLYGDKMSFEWEQIIDDGHVVFENIDDARKISAPDTDSLLPPDIAHFTRRESIADPNQPSFIQGSGHGGSHPHLVEKFLQAVVEERDSEVDAIRAADVTCAGLCAHESAMKGAARIKVPHFS